MKLHYSSWYFIILLILFVYLSMPNKVLAQQIKVNNTSFVVNGNEIFMNGVNTPWHNWNDFGGNYDHDFWNEEFKKISEAGGNCSRIWISCDGDVGIDIDSSGFVFGATEAHWKDLEDMFNCAKTHQIYIMATMFSFDHTKNSHKKYLS